MAPRLPQIVIALVFLSASSRSCSQRRRQRCPVHRCLCWPRRIDRARDAISAERRGALTNRNERPRQACRRRAPMRLLARRTPAVGVFFCTARYAARLASSGESRHHPEARQRWQGCVGPLRRTSQLLESERGGCLAAGCLPCWSRSSDDSSSSTRWGCRWLR